MPELQESTLIETPVECDGLAEEEEKKEEEDKLLTSAGLCEDL